MAWPQQNGEAQSGKGRILVVHDNATLRSGMHRMLSTSGYDVVEAENGVHALELVRASAGLPVVDVIICNLRMPHMHGMHGVTALRQEFPSIPVIVFAGFPDRTSPDPLFDHGVAEYRPKLIARDKLLAVVANAMEQRLALKGLTVLAATDA